MKTDQTDRVRACADCLKELTPKEIERGHTCKQQVRRNKGKK